MAESNNISEGPIIKESTNTKEIDSLSSSDENSNSYTDSESESESQSESGEPQSECPADTGETASKRLYLEEVDIANLAVSNNAASNVQYAKNNDSDSKLPLATQENDSLAQQNKTNEHKKEPITNGLSPDVGPEAGACKSLRPPGDLGKVGPSHFADHVLSGKHGQNPQYNSPLPLTTDAHVSTDTQVSNMSNMRKATPESKLSTVLPDQYGGAKPKGRREKPSGKKKQKRKKRKPPNDAGQEPSGKEGAAQTSRTKNHQFMGEPDYQQSTQLWSEDRTRTSQKQIQGAKINVCDTVPTKLKLEVTQTSAKMKTVPFYLDLIETHMKNDEATDSGLESLDGSSPQTPTTTAALMRDRGAAVKTDTTFMGTTDFAAAMYTAAANTATAYVAATVTHTLATTAEAIAVAGPISHGNDGATSLVSSGECDIPHHTRHPSSTVTSTKTAKAPGKALLPSSPLYLLPTPATSSITSLPVSPSSTPSTMHIIATTITPLILPTTVTTRTSTTETTTTTTSSSTSTCTTRVLDSRMGVRVSPEILVRDDGPIGGQNPRASPPAVSYPPPASGSIIWGASNLQWRTDSNQQQGMTEGQRQTIRTPSRELWHGVLQVCDILPRGADDQLCEACRRDPAVMVVFNCHHKFCEPCSMAMPNSCQACGEFIYGRSPLPS